MAIIDFEANNVHKTDLSHQGWNNIAYPRNYIDMDSDWEYQVKIIIVLINLLCNDYSN